MKALEVDPYRAFIAKLVDARRAAKVSQAELGERLKKPQSYVSKVETLERRLDVLEYVYWCKALKIEPESFVRAMYDAVNVRRRFHSFPRS